MVKPCCGEQSRLFANDTSEKPIIRSKLQSSFGYVKLNSSLRGHVVFQLSLFIHAKKLFLNDSSVTWASCDISYRISGCVLAKYASFKQADLNFEPADPSLM